MSMSTTLSFKLRATAVALAMASFALAPQAHADVVSSTNNPLNIDGLGLMELGVINSWSYDSWFGGYMGFSELTRVPERTSNTLLSFFSVAPGTTIDAATFESPNWTVRSVSFNDPYFTGDLTYAVKFQKSMPLAFASDYDGQPAAGEPYTYFGWVTVNLDNNRVYQPGRQYLQFKAWGFEDAGRSIAAGALSTPVTVSPVPEPSAYALALAGLGVAGWVARRRRVQV